MTENTDTNTETQTAEETPPENTSVDVGALRKEAAKYRTRAKDAEAALEAVSGRLTAMQRQEVQRIASNKADGFTPLADGGDLWHGDTALDALLAEDGTVDAHAVQEAARKLGEDRPHYLRRASTADGGADQGMGAAPEPPAPSFGEALKSA